MAKDWSFLVKEDKETPPGDQTGAIPMDYDPASKPESPKTETDIPKPQFSPDWYTPRTAQPTEPKPSGRDMSWLIKESKPGAFESDFELMPAIKSGVKSVATGFGQFQKSLTDMNVALSERVAAAGGMDAKASKKLLKFSQLNNPIRAFLWATEWGMDKGYFDQDKDYLARKEQKDWATKYIEDFAAVGPQMALNYASAIVAGPIGVAATMGPQIYGGSYQKFMGEGHDPFHASALALTDTAIQLPLEVLLTTMVIKGPKAVAGKWKFTDKLYNNIATGANKMGGKKILELAETIPGRIAGGAVGEGLEEFTQSMSEIVTEIGSKLLKGEKITGEWLKKTAAKKAKEGLYQAYIGAGWGAFGGAVGAILDPGKDQNPLGDANRDRLETDKSEIGSVKDARDLFEQRVMDALEEEDPVDPAIPMDMAEEIERQPVVSPELLEEDVVGEVPAIEPGVITQEPPAIPPVEEPPPLPGVEEPPPLPQAAPEAVVAERELERDEETGLRRDMKKHVGDNAKKAFIYKYMTDPASRPEGAPEAIVFDPNPQTDTDRIFNSTLAEDAERAWARARGDKQVSPKTKDFETMQALLESDFQEWQQSEVDTAVREGRIPPFEKRETLEQYYGKDWATQVTKKNMTVLERIEVAVAKMFGLNTMVVQLNEKFLAADTAYKRLRGMRMPHTGTVFLFRGRDGEVSKSTLAHEIFHED